MLTYIQIYNIIYLRITVNEIVGGREMREKLVLAGLALCLFGLIGTVGAIETDCISIKQGLIQILGFGLASWGIHERGI